MRIPNNNLKTLLKARKWFDNEPYLVCDHQKRTVISPNFLMWKYCGKAQFRAIRLSIKFPHQEIRRNFGILRSESFANIVNDTHRENCILLNSVQEFIEIEAWLLLIFFLCLRNLLIPTYPIVAY